jgi:Domain of unknown function (DUF4424)
MRRSAIALAVIAAAGPALANDSGAELSTGGLIFVRNDNVEMLAEELAISANEVGARYRFFNRSEKDVTVLVAFPLPDLHLEGPDETVSVPTEDPVNILAFTTAVNGQPVVPQVEQRVIAAGLDRTQLLRALNIPLAPHLAATGDALDRLPPEKAEELIRIGVAEVEDYDTGRGVQKHLAARWTLQTTYYWEQTFAGRAETVIEHRYRPSVGVSAQTSLGSPDAGKETWYEEYKEKYCFDYEFLAAVERARKATGSRFAAPFSEQRIDYLLRTGANGSAPIKEFRLLVDKGAADNLVSFCGDDLKPISATEVEMRKADYTPDGNLAILILKKLPTQ